VSASNYFSPEVGGTPTSPGHYDDLNPKARFPLTEGIMVRAVLGEHCMVNLVELDRGGEAPLHSHAEEQIVLVMEGEVEFDLGGDKRILGPGQAVVVSPWVTHGAIGHSERAVTVEVFGPPRAALLELMGIST
jgi:quercetin dioxygenase-like cupin family protein